MTAFQRQVLELIAGSGVFICERWIDLADEVLAKGEERSNRWTGLAQERDAEARSTSAASAGEKSPG